MLVPKKKSLHRQKGLAMVETAIAAPLLLFLMFAVAEITNAFTQYNTLVKMTQDAARYISSKATPNTTNLINLTDDQIAITKNLLVYGQPNTGTKALLQGLDPSMVSVIKFDADHISVSVAYPYQSIFGGKIPGFGLVSSTDSNFNISTRSVMRAL